MFWNFCLLCFFQFTGNNVERNVYPVRYSRDELFSYSRDGNIDRIEQWIDGGGLQSYTDTLDPLHGILFSASVKVNLKIVKLLISENLATIVSDRSYTPLGGITVTFQLGIPATSLSFNGFDLRIYVHLNINLIRQRSCLLGGQDLAYHLCGFHGIDPAILRYLMQESGCNIMNTPEGKFSCYMKATVVGNIDLITYLNINYRDSLNFGVRLKIGQDVISRYHVGIFQKPRSSIRLEITLSPLFIGVIVSLPEPVVIGMLEIGADHTFNRDIMPFEHLLVFRNKKIILRWLIDRNRCDIHSRNWVKSTLLHAAVHGGWLEMVQIVTVELRVDVNIVDVWGWNSLHYASISASIDIVKILIDRGCDTNAITESGYTSFHLFLAGTNGKFTHWMIDNYDTMWSKTQIEDVEGDGELSVEVVDTIRYFLDHGADCNIPDCNGWTPLHWSCAKGNMKFLRILIEIGHCKSFRSKRGRTPSQVARWFSRTRLYGYLSEV